MKQKCYLLCEFVLSAVLWFNSCSHQPSTLQQATSANLRLRETSSTAVRTKYEGIRNLFISGATPSPKRFTKEELLLGKCVFQNRPQQFYPDVANIYLDQDLVLGSLIYFVPTLVGMPQTQSSASETLYQISRDRARELHQRSNSSKMHFSALQFELPPATALLSLARQTISESAYLYYSNKTIGSSRNAIPNQTQFRVRSMNLKNRSYLMVEHLCPFLTGCNFSERDKRYYYLEPYAYCYYTTAFEFDSINRQVANEFQTIPVAFPTPVETPVREIDILDMQN